MNPARAGMVAGPLQYRWSSYRERMGLAGRGLLDRDASYLALGDDEAQRRQRYQAYIQQGASNQEMALVRSAWARNQLTGNPRFVDEIERRIGQRIECRGRGKPKNRA